MTGRPPPLARPRMPPPAAKEAGSRDLRERAGKGAQSAESREKRAKGAPAREPPKPGWALSLEGLEAMSPKQCHRHLLFGDLLEDVGAAASIFPRESAELGYRMPDPRAWMQSLEKKSRRQARGRVRALRLRYTYMRTPGPSPSPAAEARGDHSGGESGRQELPALTATRTGDHTPPPP
ncbi:PREDICTED: protein LKAAEAR1 [Myotis davidii]|uniref:protein LKAAEAR1 n=1 Tax=Myotis davidii TaxID=225400 RepID=UPI00076795AE|nr:PREDICTED: protein LKAAEAR1 [Myotis davidii]